MQNLSSAEDVVKPDFGRASRYYGRQCSNRESSFACELLQPVPTPGAQATQLLPYSFSISHGATFRDGFSLPL